MDKRAPVNAMRDDPHMRLSDMAADEDLEWFSPLGEPFRVNGFAWLGRERLYRRLPLHPCHQVPEAVERLADCTAGGQIRFQTDSPKLCIRVRLTGAPNMYHMPATGQCGFDCYIQDGQTAYFCATTKFALQNEEYECVMFEQGEQGLRSLIIHFPLYQGVESVEIGLKRGAAILPPHEYPYRGKVLMYGTSITQGGCATRPGMACTNILSRAIPCEFINLGFSGNGKGEPEVARLIADIEDPAILVLDYEANCAGDRLQETLVPFIRIYREAHPATPIVVVSKIPFAKEQFDPALKEAALARRDFQRDTVRQFRQAGDRSIFFLDGTRLLGEHGHECTVDGVHPTDLGFWQMAERMKPLLQRILDGVQMEME